MELYRIYIIIAFVAAAALFALGVAIYRSAGWSVAKIYFGLFALAPILLYAIDGFGDDDGTFAIEIGHGVLFCLCLIANALRTIDRKSVV